VGLPRDARFVIPPLLGQPLGDPEELPTVLLLENRGPGGFVTRPFRLADGRPLVLGTEGCSPCGVPQSGGGGLDLVVGSDDGTVAYLRREDLQW